MRSGKQENLIHWSRSEGCYNNGLFLIGGLDLDYDHRWYYKNQEVSANVEDPDEVVKGHLFCVNSYLSAISSPATHLVNTSAGCSSPRTWQLALECQRDNYRDTPQTHDIE